MGFKIVVNKKIHKLPPQISSIEDMKETINKLYPQLMNQFHLYYIFNSEPLEIIHNDALIILVRLLQLPVVKLLVSELDIQNLAQDDLTFMEQSSIYSTSTIQNNKSIQQIKPQKQVIKIEEQKQIIKIEELNQTQVPLYPQLNTFQIQDYQQQLQKQEIPQPINILYQDQIFQQQQQQLQQAFQQFGYLDKKYQYPTEAEIQPYLVELINNQQVQSYPDQEFVWKLVLRNCGMNTWPQTMKIRCIDQPYRGQQQILPEAIPGQSVEVFIKLKSPRATGNLFLNWSIYYLENTQEKSLPNTISMYLEIIKEVPEQRYQGTQILVKAEKVKQVMTDLSINYICKFIEQNRIQQWNFDDIINRLYDQQTKN